MTDLILRQIYNKSWEQAAISFDDLQRIDMILKHFLLEISNKLEAKLLGTQKCHTTVQQPTILHQTVK